MRKKVSFNNILSGFWAAPLLAIIALSLMPYGCSKEAKSPSGQQQQKSASPGKEHFDKGVQYSMKGQIDDAIKEYEATLQFDPKSSEAYNNLGFAYYDKGDTDKAIDNQKKALELNPNLANAYYGLAIALEKKGDKTGAIENWKQFAKLSQPHSKWWMKAQEHIKALEGGEKKPEEPKK